MKLLKETFVSLPLALQLLQQQTPRNWNFPEILLLAAGNAEAWYQPRKLVSWKEIPCGSNRSNHHLESETEPRGIDGRYHSRSEQLNLQASCLLLTLNFMPKHWKLSYWGHWMSLSLWLMENGRLSLAHLGSQSPGSDSNNPVYGYVPKCMEALGRHQAPGNSQCPSLLFPLRVITP